MPSNLVNIRTRAGNQLLLTPADKRCRLKWTEPIGRQPRYGHEVLAEVVRITRGCAQGSCYLSAVLVGLQGMVRA